jgi:hypothetical protein
VISATSPASPANDESPEVRGSGAEADSTVRLYASQCSGTPLGTGTAAEFNGPGGIGASVDADETTELRASATDRAGNVSACSDPFPYTEDSTPPETEIDSAPPAQSNDPTADFTFSATGGAERFECRVDAAAWDGCDSPHSTAALPDGERSFEVRAIDAAGNADPSPASRTATVDTLAPETSLDGHPAMRTKKKRVTFEFSSPDDAEAGFECRRNEGEFSRCQSPHRVRLAPRRTYVFEIRAVDPAGNLDATPVSWRVRRLR